MPKLPRVHRSPDADRLGFACPVCGTRATSVVDSRPIPAGYIRRRRRCEECSNRFSTVEVPYEAFAGMAKETSGMAEVTEALNNAIRLFNILRANRKSALKIANSLSPENRR